MTPRVALLTDPDAVQAMTHPLRIRILGSLRQADSAAGVAHALGLPRQNVNYHLKELERAGLVRATGERRRGNLIEPLYEAIATTFVVSPRVAWADTRRATALRDQVSLEHLVGLGERVQQHCAALLDRAAFDGEEIASASVEAEVCFADAKARAAFMREYLAALGPLLKKHGSRTGTAFRVAVAVYPDVEESDD